MKTYHQKASKAFGALKPRPPQPTPLASRSQDELYDALEPHLSALSQDEYNALPHMTRHDSGQPRDPRTVEERLADMLDPLKLPPPIEEDLGPELPDYDAAYFIEWAKRCDNENDISFFLAYLGWEGDDLEPEAIADIVEAFATNPMIPLVNLEHPAAAEYVDAVYQWAADRLEALGCFDFEVSR